MSSSSPGGVDACSSSSSGRQQTWQADSYAKHARFVSDLGGAVLALLDAQSGERILDLGCGDGALTQKIADCGASVLGVDLSDDLLAAAKEQGLDVQKMDGEALTFEQAFDAVFSNAALHWMQGARDVIAGVKRALKPQGRFVAEFGGHGNVAAIVTAMRAVGKAHGGDVDIAGPWFYPTLAEYRSLLEEAGFDVTYIELIPRPTPLPTEITGWLQTFRKPFFDQFGEDVRNKVLSDVVEALRPNLCDDAGQWTADYVRLRVRAVLGQ